MTDEPDKLIALSVAAKRLAEAITTSLRASDARAALCPHASRARITSANARWARSAEDRDRRMAELSKAIEALEIGDHSEVTLDMVTPTCKDVLQVADDTASKKSFLPGFYGPLWEFNEQRIHEFARRLSALQGKGVPEGWKLVPVDGLCPDCRYAYNSDACRESHEAAPEPPK